MIKVGQWITVFFAQQTFAELGMVVESTIPRFQKLPEHIIQHTLHAGDDQQPPYPSSVKIFPVTKALVVVIRTMKNLELDLDSGLTLTQWQVWQDKQLEVCCM